MDGLLTVSSKFSSQTSVDTPLKAPSEFCLLGQEDLSRIWLGGLDGWSEDMVGECLY